MGDSNHPPARGRLINGLFGFSSRPRFVTGKISVICWSKQIFPELRRWCQGRGVEFVNVDSHWGVTEEQSGRGQVLPTYLGGIECG